MKRTLALLLVVLLGLMVAAPSLSSAEGSADVTGTIRIVGPGALNGPGAEGAEDLITGVFKPGYKALIEEFNKDYPNVTIEFTETPWDNWIAVLQTAAAGGTADILLHGSMLTDISIDLSPYLEQSPEVLEALATGPEYYRYDAEDWTKAAPTGISYVVDPYFALIDKKIFEEWGIELPDKNWTWDDLLKLAQATTGANPVTGEANYGVIPFTMSANNYWKAYSSYCAANGFKNFFFDETPAKFEARHTFTSPENVAALSYFNDLIKCTPPNFLEGLGDEFAGRKGSNIAIVLGEGMLGWYTRGLADDVADQFMFLPLPVNNDQSDAFSSSFTGTNSIANSKNAADPDLAWTYIKWLITDDDAQQWLVDNLACPSTFRGIEMLREKGYTFVDSYQAIMADFWDRYSITQTDIFDVAYGNTLTAGFSAFTEMYNGNMTPEECGQAIDDAVEEYQAMNR
ncbi:MAG: extracellular solute-binding protein [Clostridiales bacterium]|nr:extracellular solute-binding protein [Clostridiales bacterium]